MLTKGTVVCRCTSLWPSKALSTMRCICRAVGDMGGRVPACSTRSMYRPYCVPAEPNSLQSNYKSGDL